MPDRPALRPAYWAVVTVAVLLTAAIFGFFYAWVCSTMWGLDDADPRVAIEAMQAMNGSVRNAVFFPAFFLTPVALALAALMSSRSGRRLSVGTPPTAPSQALRGSRRAWLSSADVRRLEM